jgi:hypothetical protein
MQGKAIPVTGREGPWGCETSRLPHFLDNRFIDGGEVVTMGETTNAHRILVGKPGGKRPLGRPRRTWVDNIKMGLREIKWDGMDWIELAQDSDQWRALVNTVMNLRVP